MASYDYRCAKCDHRFEDYYPLAQAPQEGKPCPKCGKGPTKKLIVRVGFVLTGSGFPTTNAKFKREMTKRNEDAGKRMKYRKPPVRRVGWQPAS